MSPATTRSLLVGALAASLLFAAPVAAIAVEPASVSSSALYEGVQIPSSTAELKMTASTGANVPVYSEPAVGGASLAHTLRGAKPLSGSEGRTRISEPFPAHGEKWVAIQVSEAAYGTDEAKSSLADKGVAYIRASAARDVQALGDGPAQPATYPGGKADLVTTAHVSGPMDLYKEPIAAQQHALNSRTDKWGTSLKSSAVFTYEGEPWVAVEVKESVSPGGLAYMSADPRFVIVEPVKAQPAAPTEAATAATVPSSQPAPSVSPEAYAPRLAVEAEPDVFASTVSKLPAVLFAALVMAGTMFILKRRTA